MPPYPAYYQGIYYQVACSDATKSEYVSVGGRYDRQVFRVGKKKTEMRGRKGTFILICLLLLIYFVFQVGRVLQIVEKFAESLG